MDTFETLHFDQVFMFNMASKQKIFYDECQAKLDILTLYMNDLTTTDWKAPSAQEFKSAFEEWSSKEYKWLQGIMDTSPTLMPRDRSMRETARTLAS